MADSDSDACMNEVEEVEEGGTEAEAEVESTSSESKVDLAARRERLPQLGRHRKGERSRRGLV
jgi:hypothetical protein